MLSTQFKRKPVSETYRVKFAMTRKERQELMDECGPMGLLIFEYYLRMAAVDKDIEIADSDIAEYFGIVESTAATHRRNLTKKGWILVETGKTNQGTKVVIYHLGKKEIAEHQAKLEKAA